MSIAEDFYQLCDSFYDLLRKDLPWFADGWTEGFNFPLSEDTPDFKHSPKEIEKVKFNDKDLFADYLDAAIKLSKDYLSHLDGSTLDEIIDEDYTPPVTRQTRIVLIIGDAVMHSGQAIYRIVNLTME